MSEDRTLTDADVKAIAKEMKDLLATELKLEVGGGVLAFIRTWTVRLMIAAMIYFAAVSQGWVTPPHMPHN